MGVVLSLCALAPIVARALPSALPAAQVSTCAASVCSRPSSGRPLAGMPAVRTPCWPRRRPDGLLLATAIREHGRTADRSELPAARPRGAGAHAQPVALLRRSGLAQCGGGDRRLRRTARPRAP